MQQRLATASLPSALGTRPNGSSYAAGQHPSSLPQGVADHCPTLEEALEAFLRALEGKNRSPATLQAYSTDLEQFIAWVHENNYTATTVDQVEKLDITEYLAASGQRGVSGVSRARKLAAIREYFRYLEEHGFLVRSLATGVETPKRERNGRTYLTPEEYTRMLSLAGGSPRDYAILQVFLQTGVRVSELVALRLADVDLEGRSVRVWARAWSPGPSSWRREASRPSGIGWRSVPTPSTTTSFSTTRGNPSPPEGYRSW